MLLEIIANIGLSMVSFLRGMPAEDKIKRNIELLQQIEWFQQLYQENEEFFLTDESVRYLIGWAKVEKTLTSEKRANRLREKIVDALHDK